MIKPTLVVLAAGMGSRYGGLKQMDPMGPHGETVLDYSVFDALRAGFQKVIFIIRESFEQEFRRNVGSKFEHLIQVEYAFQDLNDLPVGHSAPSERMKPWGTTHAVLAARHLIQGHFVVINADDFYGSDSYLTIANHFQQETDDGQTLQQYTMVGYPLANTLSDHGHVNRGICSLKDGFLEDIEEHTEIKATPEGSCQGINLAGDSVKIAPNQLASMNFWGFPKEILPLLEKHFAMFLTEHGQELKSECYLPTVIDELIKSQTAQCHVQETTGTWFGVTYPEDKEEVVRSIQNLVAQGQYPNQLWEIKNSH